MWVEIRDHVTLQHGVIRGYTPAHQNAMTTDSKGRKLFIVDNSVSGWTGLRYLEEWSGIAKAFDIATGYFEIGALLALDGKWQGLDKIRILMGAETTHRTRKAILEAVRRKHSAGSTKAPRRTRSRTPSCTGSQRSSKRSAPGQIECASKTWRSAAPGVHRPRNTRGRGCPFAGSLQQLHVAVGPEGQQGQVIRGNATPKESLAAANRLGWKRWPA